MSGDGGQQPVKQENGNEAVQVQSEQVQQAGKVQSSTDEQSKSNAPVKDWFGYDTGMNEEKFKEHQEAYIQRWIGIQESREKEKGFKWENEKLEKNIRERRKQNALILYQQRLNINAIPKFEKFGIKLMDYFAGYDAHGVEPYTYATTISQVVVHGFVTSTGVDSAKYPIYELKPIEILKGDFYYDKLPEKITVKVFGKFKEDQEIIAFLGTNFNTKIKKNLKDIALETIGTALRVIDKTKIYEGLYYIGEIDDIKSKIREIDTVNDTPNFYKIKF
jgi:hypothetical protein